MSQTMTEQEFLDHSASIQELIQTLNDQIYEIMKPYLSPNVELKNKLVKGKIQELEDAKQRLIDVLEYLNSVKLI